jgi:hypothetical protein
MAREGLNVATQAGEGAAPILNWDQFNQTLNTIYQRDLNNHKNIQAEYQKLSMQMGEASSKVRTADAPMFHENYGKFQQAGLMLESKKIRNDPRLQAFWKGQLEEAYFANQSLAQQSEEATKFKTDVWKNVAEHPENYHDYDELKQIDELYNKSPVGQLQKLGLNTQVPWLHPADTVPEKEVQKTIFGDTKTSSRLEPVRDPKTGKVMGNYEMQQQYSQHNPSQIARNTGFVMAASYATRKQWQQKFEYDKKNQPEANSANHRESAADY